MAGCAADPPADPPDPPCSCAASIVLTGLDHEAIDVIPAAIAYYRHPPPASKGMLHSTAQCQIYTNGAFVAVLEDCKRVRELLTGAK